MNFWGLMSKADITKLVDKINRTNKMEMLNAQCIVR